MIIEQRQSRLKEALERKGMSDLESLASELRVSISTIRRDLDMFEKKRLVKRTHGGVVWIGDRDGAIRPYAFDHRMSFQTEAKRAIARAAAKLVKPGQTIMLDGGTTTYFLAENLVGRSLQLVTNSLPIANLFLNDENIDLVLTGGMAYPRYGVLLGPAAEQFIATMHVQTMFLSVAGIHNALLYNQNALLVSAEKKMMEKAQQVVLVADSGKFGQQALAKLCELREIDVVISDTRLDSSHRKRIADAGCKFISA